MFRSNVQKTAHNNIAVDKQVLYGEDMRYSTVPSQNVKDCKIVFPAKNKTFGFGLTEDMISKHLLLLGGIGSGKTNVFNWIIDSLQKTMTNDDIMIIFDTKGDYKKIFYDENDSNHILFGNSQIYRDISKCWNIFGELKSSLDIFEESEYMLMTKEISKELFKGRGSSTQPFFVEAAADIVAKVMVHMIREKQKSGQTDDLKTSDFVSYIRESTAVSYHKMLYGYPDFKSATMYLGVTVMGRY